MTKLIPVETIVSKILFLRNEKVLLDRDLAEMYGVETKQLKRAVRRNIDRFPNDFMFKLTNAEHRSLRRQFGTLKRGAHSKYPPMAFTEQGVAMLSTVLNSRRAIEVNIAIMRAFVHLRKMIVSHKELAKKLKELEHHMRSVFKASGQVQGQGAGRSGERSIRLVCEHLSEACNAAIGPQMGF
jgi:phage regulator Rha-like protein